MKVDTWQLSPNVPVREKPVKQAVSRAEVSPDLKILQEALDAIPNAGSDSLSYDEWRDIVFAIHHATNGSDEGLNLAHVFSSRSAKYEPDFLNDRVWPYVGKRDDGPVITDRSIYSRASTHGWQDPRTADDFDDLSSVAAPTDPLTKKKKRKFEFVPAHQFAAGEPPGWIIKHVLPRQELIVVYGESGAGKSFAVLDMLGHIAEELPWRGHKVTAGLNVAYIVAEGAAGFRLRLDAFAKHFSASLGRLAVMAGAPSFMEKEDILIVGKAMLAYGKLDVLVVDTLAQVTAGANENSGEDMGRVIAHCKTLHTVTGATIVLIHHSGKDASRGARGWSGIKGALDAEIEITRNGAERTIVVSKLKDGKGEGAQFGFRLLDVPLGMDDDGEVFGSCVVEHVAMSIERGAMPKGKHETLVYRIVLDLAEPGEAPLVEAVLTEYQVRTPADPQAKRDTRRQHALRAIAGLTERGVLRLNGTRLEMPNGENGMGGEDDNSQDIAG